MRANRCIQVLYSWCRVSPVFSPSLFSLFLFPQFMLLGKEIPDGNLEIWATFRVLKEGELKSAYQMLPSIH